MPRVDTEHAVTITDYLQEWRPRRILDSLLNSSAWFVVGFTIGYALNFFR